MKRITKIEENNALSVKTKTRVAAYCRVSTASDEQLISLDTQKAHYEDYIKSNSEWEYAGVFFDEGITGTKKECRDGLNSLIDSCEKGLVDLVITKSISRFARNTQDCLAYSRKLKNLGIGIIFEKENINTLDSTGELLFTILSSLAQDESRNISENCKWGIRTKFKNGEMHLNTFKFLGYDKDENGKLVINKEQAKTVRRIYRDFLIGINPAQIAKELTEEKVPGCNGQTKWYPSTIVGILKQEKHMGDALLQKTYTADFLTKRQVKNNGEIAQVYVKDSHKGIIDKETWNAVQEEFERRERFMKDHGTDRYSYGADCMPFCEKVFCGECKSLFTRHSWKSRGIVQWQCKNHRTDGRVTCSNAYVDNSDIEKGFVKAFNKLVADREKFMERWNQMKTDGSPLEKIRAEQMMEATGNEPLGRFVSEIAQLVLAEVTVLGAKKYEFFFLEGSRIKVSV